MERKGKGRKPHRETESSTKETNESTSNNRSDDIFKAKPRDLSKDALVWDELDASRNNSESNKVFTQKSFENIGLNSKLIKELTSPTTEGGFGLTRCTNVQSLVLPHLLQDHRGNLLIKSQTGSGKTLAYLLPIMEHFMSLDPPLTRSDGCRALVIAPTRELCTQISDVVNRLTQCFVRIVGGNINGGEKRKSEKARLRKGVVILVGTPGRLLDHIRHTDSFALSKLSYVVLDEFDRLLDMGFEQTILEILSHVNGKALPGLKDTSFLPFVENNNKPPTGNLEARWKQQQILTSKKCATPNELVHLLVSATLGASVQTSAWNILSHNYNVSQGREAFSLVDGEQEVVLPVKSEKDIKDYIMAPPKASDGAINESNPNEMRGSDGALGASVIPSSLSQYSMLVTCKWKFAALLSFLYLRRHQKIIVFFSTCDSVDFHSLLFREMQWPEDLDKEGAFQPSTNTYAFGSMHHNSKGSDRRVLEPLQSRYSGIFGEDVPLFRLHGQVPQHQRKEVFTGFCNATKGMLFCTDVAARGLDLPHVDWIVQYDPPCDTSDYVHRIGRTARKGEQGSAVIFLLPSEAMYTSLLSSYHMNLAPLASQSVLASAASQGIPGAMRFKNSDEMAAVILQRRAENVVANNWPLQQAGAQAYTSFVRAYATHSADAKGIFRVQSLHLGHVAKSFALRDLPSELENELNHTNNNNKGNLKEDIIAKITKGDFSAALREEKRKLQEAREEKEREEKKNAKKLLKKRKVDEVKGDEEDIEQFNIRNKKSTTDDGEMAMEIRQDEHSTMANIFQDLLKNPTTYEPDSDTDELDNANKKRKIDKEESSDSKVEASNDKEFRLSREEKTALKSTIRPNNKRAQGKRFLNDKHNNKKFTRNNGKIGQKARLAKSEFAS